MGSIFQSKPAWIKLQRGFLPPKAIYTHTPNDQSTKTYLNVLLLGIFISQGYNEIQEIYAMINFT